MTARTTSGAATGAITAALLALATFAGRIEAQGQPGPSATPPPADGYYTEAQAIRGKFYFNRHCAYCHAAAGGRVAIARFHAAQVGIGERHAVREIAERESFPFAPGSKQATEGSRRSSHYVNS